MYQRNGYSWNSVSCVPTRRAQEIEVNDNLLMRHLTASFLYFFVWDVYWYCDPKGILSWILELQLVPPHNKYLNKEIRRNLYLISPWNWERNFLLNQQDQIKARRRKQEFIFSFFQVLIICQVLFLARTMYLINVSPNNFIFGYIQPEPSFKLSLNSICNSYR